MQYSENKSLGSLSEELSDIERKIDRIDKKYYQLHFTISNIFEIFFDIVVPIIVSTYGSYYLYCYLIDI